MKNLLHGRIALILLTLLFSTQINAQIVTAGISPAPIATSYNFTWADPQGGDWSTPDFNIPGTFVQDTLMLVEDGTAGTNPQGNPVSQEGCFPLTNNLTGKIAVVYRNTCEFGEKAFNAQTAGAVGVIIISNSPTIIQMGGGAQGINVTIPVVMINDTDGAALVAAMGGGSVVMLLGNVYAMFTTNLGIGADSTLIAPLGGFPNQINNSYPVQALIYNHGTAASGGSVEVSVENSLGTQVYFNMFNSFSLNSGDSLTVPLGTVPSLPDDDYTITYTITPNLADQFSLDNSYISNHKIQDVEISYAELDVNNLPITDNYYSYNFSWSFSYCNTFKDPNASAMALEGIDYSAYVDTSMVSFVGENLWATVYEWNDVFVDMNDPGYGFNNLLEIENGEFIGTSNSEVGQNIYIPFFNQVNLVDNQRYLICLSTYSPDVYLGSADINYSGNFIENLQPMGMVELDGDYYYLDGNVNSFSSMGLRISDCPGATVVATNEEGPCFGLSDGSISVNAAGFSGTPSFLWSTGGTTNSISNLAAGTYTVTVTDTSGCSMDKSYTINEYPQMTPEALANDESCAALNDGSASAWMFSGGVGPISYVWSTGDTTSSISGLDNGSYSYTMTDAVGCSVSGTVNIGTGTVDFSLGVQASATSGISPLLVIFDNQTPNLPNYTFTWIFGDGSSEQNNSSFVSHTYLVDGLWDVVLIAEDNITGCLDTLFLNGYIFTTGGVPCTHTASINQFGPYTFCQGDSVLLTCNNNPAFTYQWNLNGIGLSGENNDSIYAMLDGDYTVTIYENNCPVVSSAVTVNVNTSPSIPVITGTGTITACAGGSVTLDAPLGYAGYLWSTGGTGTSEVVTTSGNYTVEVTNGNGCSSISAPYVINASFMAIQEICLVGLDSVTNNNRIIWEHPVTTGIDSFFVYKEGIMANVYDKIGATHYLDTAVFIDQNSNPAVQAYRYKVTILDTCGTETALGDFHKTIHLTINQGVGQTWNLIWSHYEGFTFPSYNIYRGTTPGNMTLLTTIASNLNSYTDLSPPGGVAVYYQIEIVNPNPCDPILKMTNYNNSLSNIVVNGDAGIQNLSNDGSVSIYPNPTKGELIVKTSLVKTPFDITILDAQGKIIMSERCDSDLKEMNISSLETGIYFVRINNDSINRTVRIVKQ